MDVKALANNFAAFLTKHSGELRLVGSALETIVGTLPIDAQDKSRLLDTVSTLQKAAGNIAAGAEALAGATVEVVIAKEDVVEAVREFEAETHQTETASDDPSHGPLAVDGQDATGNGEGPGNANGA